ncbi:MAG: Crp/Fnr family transcriptional regulator [Hyphomicrobiales bacterium]|nr:Crp/Fnr family transcriptional regulator [Hyphomicrobiales bacterium]
MPKTIFDFGVLAGADLGVVALADGGAVYSKGDPGDRAYVVHSGTVDLRCMDDTVEVLGPGEIFGLAAVLDGGVRFCSAIAVGKTELIPLSRSLVETLVGDDPEFAAAVTALMVRRLRAAFARLDPAPAGKIAEPGLNPIVAGVADGDAHIGR